jgi:hypothetical protein
MEYSVELKRLIDLEMERFRRVAPSQYFPPHLLHPFDLAAARRVSPFLNECDSSPSRRTTKRSRFPTGSRIYDPRQRPALSPCHFRHGGMNSGGSPTSKRLIPRTSPGETRGSRTRRATRLLVRRIGGCFRLVHFRERCPPFTQRRSEPREIRGCVGSLFRGSPVPQRVAASDSDAEPVRARVLENSTHCTKLR